MYQSPNNLFET